MGDIVEAQLSFVVFPIKEAKFKMALILRAIALLDHTETDVSQSIYYIPFQRLKKKQHIQKALHCRSSISRPSTTLPPVTRLKRKAGYDEKEDEEIYKVRKRFQEMYIEPENH
jgi:hypothetical protein